MVPVCQGRIFNQYNQAFDKQLKRKQMYIFNVYQSLLKNQIQIHNWMSKSNMNIMTSIRKTVHVKSLSSICFKPELTTCHHYNNIASYVFIYSITRITIHHTKMDNTCVWKFVMPSLAWSFIVFHYLAWLQTLTIPTKSFCLVLYYLNWSSYD